MKMITKPFKGSNVFLSRNLIPPEIFDTLHDALKLNGAQVYLCCDPSRTGPNDYHVISSPQHEKFDDLKAKGCKLLGPQCVLCCAKENRNLPEQKGFTCCMAMDGVKVLASGFEKDEKAKIDELVTAMGGTIQTRTSMDISFVIVKNVLAAKYKWALTVLKKPIVTISWLYQCWNEHRVVSQEPYRVLPFSGLIICVTRVKADLRKEMAELVKQNGGEFSGDLTRKCTHLVTDAPEGDKYIAAKRWGHIHIVTRKWFDQSIARRACLDEDSYPVQASSSSSIGLPKGGMRGGSMGQHSQVKARTDSQSVQSSVVSELETSSSQNTPPTAFCFNINESNEAHNIQPGDETTFDGLVADDSQTEDNDFYLSDCRILFVGFQASEMRKLVNLVHKGGGSRCMSLSEEKLTHIVVGIPSENEKKEIRHVAALGIVYVVKTTWLEDCDREKKEVPVSQRHISDLLPPKVGFSGVNQRNSMDAYVPPTCQPKTYAGFGSRMSLQNSGERKGTTNLEGSSFSEETMQSNRQGQFTLNDGFKDHKTLHSHSVITVSQERKLSSVFQGLLFRFSSSFPEERRAEVVEWVKQGKGAIVDDHSKQKVQFIIEDHGLMQKPSDLSQTTVVSTHWIKFSLEGESMPDVGSHILFSPLRCHVPFPGFEGFKFCTSQYQEKDKLLLRNLCVILGAKFTDKLTKSVTHLICKFSSGPKYEAACKWRMQLVTSEWISECIKQDTVVPMDSFRPKDVTAQDCEAGLYTMTQYPSQAAPVVYGDTLSQLPSQSQLPEKIPSVARNSNFSKRVRITDGDNHNYVFPAELHEEIPTEKIDLLRQSNKYGTACKRGISVTSELVSECIRQDPPVLMDSFGQKDSMSRDHGEKLCTTSQYPTQAAGMTSGAVPFHSDVLENMSSNPRNGDSREGVMHVDNNNLADLGTANIHKEVPTGNLDFMESNTSDVGNVSPAVPDVASAIEDLLAQSNKIQDKDTPGRSESDPNIFSPDCSILGQHHVDSQSVFGISNWLSRTEKQADLGNSSGIEAKSVPYDGFSETQTESQVVVYEDDLSGRQRIIERVQTRSSLT